MVIQTRHLKWGKKQIKVDVRFTLPMRIQTKFSRRTYEQTPLFWRSLDYLTYVARFLGNFVSYEYDGTDAMHQRYTISYIDMRSGAPGIAGTALEFLQLATIAMNTFDTKTSVTFVAFVELGG